MAKRSWIRLASELQKRPGRAHVEGWCKRHARAPNTVVVKFQQVERRMKFDLYDKETWDLLDTLTVW